MKEKIKDILAISITILAAIFIAVIMINMMIKIPLVLVINLIFAIILWSAWRLGEITGRRK